MKYFAMIDGRQVGPFELDDVVREGIRPDTYVWCKGMADWEQAQDVPDICRYFRQRLSGSLPSLRKPSAGTLSDSIMEQEELIRQFPPSLQGFVRRSGVKLTKDSLPQPDRHRYSRTLPVILYIICLLLILLGFLISR